MPKARQRGPEARQCTVFLLNSLPADASRAYGTLKRLLLAYKAEWALVYEATCTSDLELSGGRIL